MIDGVDLGGEIRILFASRVSSKISSSAAFPKQILSSPPPSSPLLYFYITFSLFPTPPSSPLASLIFFGNFNLSFPTTLNSFKN
jgi:hypothetical protein